MRPDDVDEDGERRQGNEAQAEAFLPHPLDGAEEIAVGTLGNALLLR